MPRILFVTSPQSDYLATNLLHGLRELLGADVVDWPRDELLYETAGDGVRSRAYGRGFTAFFRSPEVEVDRDHVWERAHDGEFDLIVFGDVSVTFGLFAERGVPLRGRVPIAVVDGTDSPAMYPAGPFWWRRRAWWLLPRLRGVDVRFKRELGPWTHRTAVYGLLPAALARRVGPTRGTLPIAFAIPESIVAAAVPDKHQRFPTHIVDEELAERVGAETSYAFADESAYYDDLGRSRFGITTKRHGWDCMRHYEIAASGAVICFRELSRKPDSCAPHGLIDGVNCLDYRDPDDLLERLDALSPGDELRLQEAALAWARANTTVRRAEQFLAACGV